MTDSEAGSSSGNSSNSSESEEKKPAPSGEALPRRRRASVTGALFHDVARALGRTAGRTKKAIERLGERGVISIAVKKLRREKNERLKQLGQLARKALSRPEGAIRSGDPRVGELLHSLDRLDEKIERLMAEAEDEEPSEGPDEEDATEEDVKKE